MNRLKRFSWNESHLVGFYQSGELDTAERFKFVDVHRPFTISESETAGKGLFLRDAASPGELLIVSNAIASCACIRECTPYKEDSFVHAPKAAWKPPRPRIPPEVHEHLANKLARDLDNADEQEQKQIMDLDSHDPNDSTNDFSSLGNRKSSNRETSSTNGSETDELSRRLWNIVANNALCNKVRSLSHDEPKQVETCDLWGVWILPSHVNHSCAPNCHRMRVGKAMFIRAAVKIAAGDELTLPYFDIFEPLTLREANCRTFGFRCECRRCTIERSLGQGYNDIQRQIVQLKMQLEIEWTSVNRTGRSEGKAKMLLKQQASLIFAINELLVEILDSGSTKRGSKLQKNLVSRMYEVKEHCIKASFIDAHIAMYALCATTPFTCLENGLDPLMLLGDSSISEIEEGRCEQRTIYAVTQILHIITEVHPGNMLGQEFFSILLKAFSRLATCDTSENLADYIDEHQEVKSEGMSFYSRYYGCVENPAILEELLGIES